jgi:hypothetical protein
MGTTATTERTAPALCHHLRLRQSSPSPLRQIRAIEKSEVEAVAPWIAIALGRVSELINLSLICVSLTQKETYFVKGTRNEQGLKKILKSPPTDLIEPTNLYRFSVVTDRFFPRQMISMHV